MSRAPFSEISAYAPDRSNVKSEIWNQIQLFIEKIFPGASKNFSID